MAYFRAVIRAAVLLAAAEAFSATTAATGPATRPVFDGYILDFNTPVDPALQATLEAIDARLRARHGITDAGQTNVGVLDLADRGHGGAGGGKTPRVAMIHPDQIEYAASVPKIGILLAYFQIHPEAAEQLDPTIRHELATMIRASSNEIASKYSHQIGLKQIQAVLDRYGFYDAYHGGGLWVGKHYGKDPERYVDPVGGHSHAATVRQLLRFYLLLEQGRLVSPAVSRVMREQIFAAADVPAMNDRFVKGLAGREGLTIIRKAGWWEDWRHDTAVVTGPGGRHYVLVALTHAGDKGDAYLEDLVAAVDDAMREE